MTGVRGAATHTGLLARRLAEDLLATPAHLIGAVGFAAGFVLFEDALLGGSPAVTRAVGGDYLAFLVPTGLLVAAAASGAAGYMLVEDADDGYLDRLLTMPVARAALVAAPILTAGLFSVACGALVLGLAAVAGATPAAGVPGAAVMIALAGAWGLGVAGYMVTAALLARAGGTVRLVELSGFFLLFLAPVLFTRDALRGWVRPIADANPTTYVIEALRDLMLHGWRPGALAGAASAALAFAAVSLAVATLAARHATRRA